MEMSGKTIRVLVVDDSPLARELITAVLTSEPDIVVAAEAGNGLEAVQKIAAVNPDIVTMDIEMPVMGGLEAIGRIMSEHPVPILAVTALTGVRTAFSAVAKGALDVVEKPDVSLENRAAFLRKIRLLARIDVRRHLSVCTDRSTIPAAQAKGGSATSPGTAIVAIAASTGGPQAVHSILSRLPATFPAPIVITQHIAEGFTQGMVDWLDGATALKVSVARSGERLAAGNVYVNPAEHSMRVTEKGMILLGDRDARRYYHPCCDTMLTSVASAWRERAVGLILSGMGDDGVLGMEAIRKNGGTTLAQDEKSSVIYGMNRCAVERGQIQRVLPLADIPSELTQRIGGGKC